MPENYPSYISKTECGVHGFQFVYFSSDLEHDNQEKSFLSSRDETTKCRKLDFSSAVLLSKDLDQKREIWRWIKEASFKMESGSSEEGGFTYFHLLSFADPNSKKYILYFPMGRSLIFVLFCFLPSNNSDNENHYNSGHEKLPQPEHLLSSNWLSFASISQFPFLSKASPSFFVV